MGFVTEYLDDNAREFLKRYELPIWGKWTLDRKREIYLTYVNTTVQDEVWEDYCMIYKTKKIEITVQVRSGDTTSRMFIERIIAPKCLKPDRDDIVAAIREAFTQMYSVNLIQGSPPVKRRRKFIIEEMAEPQFGFRELHNGRVMLLEIISGGKSVMLHRWFDYGMSRFDLSDLLADAERQCRDNHMELADFLTKGKDRIWGILGQNTIEKFGEEIPDWCWNRDTQKLYCPEEK